MREASLTRGPAPGISRVMAREASSEPPLPTIWASLLRRRTPPTRALRIWSGVAAGRAAASRAAAPLTWAAATEVPEVVAYEPPLAVDSTFWPGAARSTDRP